MNATMGGQAEEEAIAGVGVGCGKEATISLKKRGDIRNILEELKMKSYQEVKRLQFYIMCKKSGKWGKSLNHVMKLLGSSLPKLEQVSFGSSCRSYLPVDALKEFLTAATGTIQKLHFDHVYFLYQQQQHRRHHQEVEEELDGGLWALLTQLQQLELIELNHCRETSSRDNNNLDLLNWTPLIRALTNVPTLKTIIIKSWRSSDHCGALQLQPLLMNCHQLQHIEIKGLEVSPSGFADSVAPILQTHPNLHTFKWGSISFQTPQAQEALVHCLTNNTCLHTLEFTPKFDSNDTSFYWNGFQSQHWKFMVNTIPKALQNNTSIQRCEIHLTRDVGVSKNTMMIPFDVQAACLELVRDHNWILEELALTNGCAYVYTTYTDPDLHRCFQHYLKLNQLGRKKLQQQHEQLSQNDWILVLQDANDDVSCLYEVLKMNPSIVSTSSNQPFKT